MEDMILAYDVTRTRRRTRLFKLLHRWGAPVQKSVFALRVRPGEFPALRRKAEREIDPATDALLYLFLCPRCRARVRYAGCCRPLDQDDHKVL